MLPAIRRRQKIINGVLIILVLSLTMSWSSSNPERIEFIEDLFAQALHPLQVGVNAVADFFVSSHGFMVDVRNVFIENRELKEQLSQYAGIEYELLEVRHANRRLRELLDFAEDAPFETTPAQVIGRNPSTWFSTVTIDKGSNDGIELDMPVVTHRGLVGKVISVSPTFSKVQLIISPDSGISAIVQRTRDNGVLLGLTSPAGYTQLTRLPADSNISEGDVIISSPLTGIYPKGLVIGRVVEVYDDLVTLERSALIRPEVDFERLEEVLIIVNYD
ncbi:MAG: rod shape-determining protein MreC [Firmicutes bacterium]|nr:rod shape-determining protein MreC [Bacillota bacterium]